MTFDWTINFPTVLTVLGGIAAIVIWGLRLEGRVDINRRSIDTLSKTLSALEALVELTRAQFHEYQLQVAKEFMTQAAFSEIKRDLIDEMNKMERRMEQAIDRAFRAGQER